MMAAEITAVMTAEITAAVMTTAVMVVEAPIALMPAAMGASVMSAARMPNMVVLLVLLPLLVPDCFFYLSTLSCTVVFDVSPLIIFLLAEDETDQCPATLPV
jgi:hypothetical protein